MLEQWTALVGGRKFDPSDQINTLGLTETKVLPWLAKLITRLLQGKKQVS